MSPRIALVATALVALFSSVACEKTETATVATAEKPVASAMPSAKPVETNSVCSSPPPPGNHPEWCKQCPDQCQGMPGPHASAAPVPAKHDKPLKELVAGAQTARITESDAKRKTVDVTSAKEIAAIVDALGPSQTSTSDQPRCMSPFAIALLDGGGKTLALVALCDTPGLAESNKPLGRLEEPKDQAGGFTVANLGALRAALAPRGIDLP